MFCSDGNKYRSHICFKGAICKIWPADEFMRAHYGLRSVGVFTVSTGALDQDGVGLAG